jgi:hypothetical protein
MKRLALLPVLVLAACLAGTAQAQSSRSSASLGGCPAFAASVSQADAANVLDFNFSQGLRTPADPRTMPYMSYAGQAPLAGTALTQAGAHTYLIQGRQVMLHYGKMTYVIAAGSFFRLTCSGVAKGAPLKPTIYLGSGKAIVEDPSSFSGGAMTLEGLYGAVPGAKGALRFTVTRKTAKPVTNLADFFLTSEKLVAQSVKGTTTVAINGATHVNVTPYTGVKVGSCRHVRDAVLNSSRNIASYSGYGN